MRKVKQIKGNKEKIEVLRENNLIRIMFIEQAKQNQGRTGKFPIQIVDKCNKIMSIFQYRL